MPLNVLDEYHTHCPYCGESISLLIDASALSDSFHDTSYIEDCEVCCRPIRVTPSITENDGMTIALTHENEV